MSVEELTTRANDCLGRSDFQKAYSYVCLLAEQAEADAHTGVAAGLLALQLGKRDEARTHFRRVREKAPEDFDSAYNLSLLALGDGNLIAAAEILQELLTRDPGNAALYNDLGVIRMQQRNFPAAFELFERCLYLDPNFYKARQNVVTMALGHGLAAEGRRLLDANARHPQVTDVSRADIVHRLAEFDRLQPVVSIESPNRDSSPAVVAASRSSLTGKRIAFFAAHDTFVKDVIGHLSHANVIRQFKGGSIREMTQLLDWADLAWFEWCDALIIEATRLPKHCPIVCRLHSYEAFTDMPRQVDWSKVDHLIFVNRSVEELFRRQVSADVATVIVPNGVDLKRFVLPHNKTYGKKIASVGYINYKKNPALLLYCFKKIHSYDSEYSLHIAGQHQDPRIQLYFEHFLRGNPLPVHYYGWVEDMPAWYADQDFVISTSLFESFHYSIAEGIACGLMPLIHDWYGATNLYPPEYLFSDPDDCLALIQRLSKSDRCQLARQNRQYIAQRFSQKNSLKQLEDILTALIVDVEAKSDNKV
ncbi:MAG TPA: tetratricopeptide repeat protein [Candidatus Deferrimicrobium sp.]|nr:tetratricopeptide repeat protein [Candidatus Deferrimicrobium sp.]